MKNFALTLTLIALSFSTMAQNSKKDVMKAIDAKSEEYTTIAKKIWDYAEVEIGRAHV